MWCTIDTPELGILSWRLNADDWENDENLKKIREARGYSYMVCISELVVSFHFFLFARLICFSLCRIFVMCVQKSCQTMRLSWKISLKNTCILMKRYAIVLREVVCIFIILVEHLITSNNLLPAIIMVACFVVVTYFFFSCSSRILRCQGPKWSVDPCSSEERGHDCFACGNVSPLHIGQWQLHQGIFCFVPLFPQIVML